VLSSLLEAREYAEFLTLFEYARKEKLVDVTSYKMLLTLLGLQYRSVCRIFVVVVVVVAVAVAVVVVAVAEILIFVISALFLWFLSHAAVGTDSRE
jgi:hypothetical protein